MLQNNKKGPRESAVNNIAQKTASSGKKQWKLAYIFIYLLISLNLPKKISRALHGLVLEMARHSNMKSDVVKSESHHSEGFRTL